MIEYTLYPVNEIIDLLKGYEEQHYRDIKDKTMYPSISMNWEIYEALGQEGLCFAVIARDGEELVGYTAYTLNADLNANNKVIAISVAMYIEKKYRGRLIVEFINKCDRMLKEKDVKQVLHSYSDVRIGKILQKADYRPKSITWCKSL
jgi:hypothetical protein